LIETDLNADFGRQPHRDVEAHVSRLVAVFLGIDAGEIDRDRPLMEYGLSSVAAVQVSVALEQTLRRRVMATLIWNYPTVRAIAAALNSQDAAAIDALDCAESGALAPETGAFDTLAQVDAASVVEDVRRLSDDQVRRNPVELRRPGSEGIGLART
jgi:acyl carrier protein